MHMADGRLAFVDYAVIGVFFAVMVGVGVYYSRRSRSSAQFFGNDKTVPWWLSGVSFYMNSFSALAFVMYSALAYKYGWVPVTVSWLSVPAVLLGAWFLAVRWRRAAKASPIDYISERYTPGMCRLMAWMGLPMQLLDNAFKMLAIGTVVGVGMGFPLFWALCISGTIIIVYSFLGGLKATLTCDFIQFLVIMAVVLVLPPLCLGRLASLDGGIGVMHGLKVFVERAPEGFFSLVAGPYGWFYMVVFFFNVGASLSTNWPLVQRYYSTRSEKDAKKMAYLVAALLFFGPPLFFFPAMAARIFMPGLGESDMNGVYATLCRAVLPAGMLGMVIAAMFSATMSSLAGNFNAIASVMVNDIYVRIDRKAPPGRLLLAARVAVVVVGMLVVVLAFLMQYVQGCDDLFNMANKCFVFLAPIAIPMVVGLFARRISTRAGMTALVGGSASGLVLVAASCFYADLLEMTWMYPITSAVTIALLWVGSKWFPDGPSETARVNAFFCRIADSETRIDSV